MAQSERQRQMQYLVNLGFNISTKTSAQRIQSIYDSVQTLEASLQNLGEDLELPVSRSLSSINGLSHQLNEYLTEVSRHLNDLHIQQATTFRAMKDGTIEVTRAFGDLARAQAQITEDGWSDYSVTKSGVANRAFPKLSLDDTLAKQTEISTIEMASLGEKDRKFALKSAIQESLKGFNTEAAQLLLDNEKLIEQYVERAKIYYDTDGKAIRSFVELKLGEFQKLQIGQRYLTESIETDDGTKTSRISARTTQQLSTDTASAFETIRKGKEKLLDLEDKIAKAQQKGLTAEVSRLEDQEKTLSDDIAKKQEEYVRLTTQQDTYTGQDKRPGEQRISELDNAIQHQRDLDTAVRDENEQRGITNELATEYQRNQREIFDFQKKMDSAIRSGNETYETSLRASITLLEISFKLPMGVAIT